MCVTMTVHEAQADFSGLLVRVSQGEEVIISQGGQPVARIVPVLKSPVRRRPGSAAGQVVIHPDFDAPLPTAVLDAFEQ